MIFVVQASWLADRGLINSPNAPSKGSGYILLTNNLSTCFLKDFMIDTGSPEGAMRLRNILGGSILAVDIHSQLLPTVKGVTIIKRSEHQSDVVGVCFDRSRVPCWVATWYENCKQRHKRFSVRIYGYEAAKHLAEGVSMDSI